jgi:hypothetical protein
VKATVSVTDENGNRYEGNVELLLAGDSLIPTQEPPTLPRAAASSPIDFSLPLRAFVRTYAASNPSGAARFVVLLAHLVKGANTDVPAETVRTEWGKLTAHLGAFNRAHMTRAKDRAWVDSAGPGEYRLGPRWREAFPR